MRTLSLLLVSVLSLHAAPLKVLFLGDAGHHVPAQRFAQLQPVFAARGIELAYTDKLDDLNAANLAKFDGVMIFANHLDWSGEQEKALLDYVRSGKGFIPVHCASFCFTKSQAYIDLVGAQFRSHGTGVFRTETVAKHPIMNGCESFGSWDETYVHHKHNANGRTVLEERVTADHREPWTWVRDEGKGRVFYTAWGHDHRTWSHPGFHSLLERGTKWACGVELKDASTYIDRPAMTPFAADAPKFEMVPAKLPHYVGSHKLGGDITTMQKPLSAADSLKHYTVPEGFAMKPFITEELYGGGKPIAMTWDDKGRLFLAVSLDYPNEKQPAGKGRDKILLCEDSDGDGAADKVRVFADKLSIPTSLLWVHGGLLVHQAPETHFIKDGKTTTLFSGWGVWDTHAGPSNLRMGPDGWIYSMCGYSGFNGEVNGEKVQFKQGLFRFNFDGEKVSKLEFLRSTSNNSWGVGFNKQGELFGSTANGCPLVHLAIPNRYYEKVKGLTPKTLENIALDNHVEAVVKDYRQVDFHGGFTAAAACTPYTGNAYPKEYDNVVFICEPTAHLVAAMKLEPHGTSYVARYGWNLCASRDDWAAPIDAQVGPDGNVWVIDWYNIIVQHNPTPVGFKTGAGNAYEIDLRDKKCGRVYRVVYEGNNQRTTLSPKPGYVSGKVPDPEYAALLRSLLIQVDDPDLKQFSKGKLYQAHLPENLILDSKVLGDANLRDALTIAAVVHAERVLKALATNRYRTHQTFNPFIGEFQDPYAKTFPTSSIAIIELVAKNFASGKQKDKLGSLLAAAQPGPALDPILRGLLAGMDAKTKVTFSEEQQKAITTLLTKLTGPAKGRLLKIAQLAGMPGLDAAVAAMVAESLAVVADAKATDDVRLDAAKQVLEMKPDADVAPLIAAAVTSPKLGTSIFELLANAKGAGTTLMATWKELPTNLRPQALRLILARPDSTAAFLSAVEKGELRFDVLALEQKTALSNHPNNDIRDRARKILALGGGLPDADRQKVIDHYKPLLEKPADVKLGKAAFTQHCAKCHKHGSEGQTIGPDLTGFAVHPKEEILIHVMDPSRSVEGNFKTWTASLADGRVIMGLLASESKTSIELLDAENKRHAIAREDIDSLKESPKSLMPEGFEKQMKEEEVLNVLAFLTAKGKWLPIPLDKAATATSAKGLFYDPEGTAERLILKDWSPREVKGVPFHLVDPQGGQRNNVILLHAENGVLPRTMPKNVSLPCHTPAKAIHLLSGVSGWGYLSGKADNATAMTVRLHYKDGELEDHALKNGVHFADYIRRVDVKESEFAFFFEGKQQMRYVKVVPKKAAEIATIELVKGSEKTSPIVMAVTVETP